MSLNFWMEGIAMPFVSIFGLFGNVMIIYILHNHRNTLDMSNNFSSILICLAAFDAIGLVLANCIYPPCAILGFSSHILAFPYIYPLIQMADTGSLFTVVALTVERYTAIRQIHKRFLTRKVFIFLVIIFPVAFNFIKFFEIEIKEDNTKEFGQQNSSQVDLEMEKDPSYLINYTWLHMHPIYFNYSLISEWIVIILIPMASLGIFTFLTYRIVKRSVPIDNSSESCCKGRNMATLMFFIVAALVFCKAPRVTMVAIQDFQKLVFGGELMFWPAWCQSLSYWSHLLLAFNNCINIVIYTAKDFKFRRALVSIFVCKESKIKTVAFQRLESKENVILG